MFFFMIHTHCLCVCITRDFKNNNKILKNKKMSASFYVQ
jgi:hypothetical protein